MIDQKQLLINKNLGKQYQATYLKELNALFNDSIDESDLLSLEKTEEIRDQSIGTLSNKSIIKIDLSFEDKSQLKEIIDNLSGVAGSILVFTDYSNYCGAARIADLSKFNTQFNFEDEHSGIISILSQDLTNNLVIDFYEENGQHHR